MGSFGNFGLLAESQESCVHAQGAGKTALWPPQSKTPAFVPLRRGKQAAWFEYVFSTIIQTF
jgi:hypothetical protein